MRIVVTIGVMCLLLIASCTGETPQPESPTVRNAEDTSKTRRRGYVLKHGQGEVLGSDIIKASPQSGTQGSVMILQAMSGGFSTGLHTHVMADELFYVISGRGIVVLDKDEHVVEAGDVFFAPAGLEHKVFVEEGARLEVMEFLDKPGLDEEFRVWHKRLSGNAAELTLEEVNGIAGKYGTVYRTLK